MEQQLEICIYIIETNFRKKFTENGKRRIVSRLNKLKRDFKALFKKKSYSWTNMEKYCNDFINADFKKSDENFEGLDIVHQNIPEC